MRKLAQALGVEAMSLYHHVANKSDILDGMVDLVFCEIDLPDEAADWTVAMTIGHDRFAPRCCATGGRSVSWSPARRPGRPRCATTTR